MYHSNANVFVASHKDDFRGLSHVPAPQMFTGEDYVAKEPREHLHGRLKFFLFTLLFITWIIYPKMYVDVQGGKGESWTPLSRGLK